MEEEKEIFKSIDDHFLSREEFEELVKPEGNYFWAKIIQVDRRGIRVKYRAHNKKWMYWYGYNGLQEQVLEILIRLKNMLVLLAIDGEDSWLEVLYQNKKIKFQRLWEKWSIDRRELDIKELQDIERDIREITGFKKPSMGMTEYKTLLGNVWFIWLTGFVMIGLKIFC